MEHVFGRFEAVICRAIVSLGGRANASRIYDQILVSGERALLANIYTTLERLEDKNAVERTLERRVTDDGKERDVNMFALTGRGSTILDATNRLRPPEPLSIAGVPRFAKRKEAKAK